MKIIKEKTFDEERAFYNAQDITLQECRFVGEKDGESACKEGRNISVDNCLFQLRYPFWHDTNLFINDTQMSESCRAAIWYCDHVEIKDSLLYGIKALRECRNVKIERTTIHSAEFGWSTNNIDLVDCEVESEYFMLHAHNTSFQNVGLKGKYSFQYNQDGVFKNCVFDTKDAFWHAKNLRIENSVIKGEYLAWYSENVTLVNCKIIGTQPFCYCKNLKLIDCEMIDTDLCFERSHVEATITTRILSIKNPLSGHIYVPEVEEIIMDIPQAKGKVVLSKQEEERKQVYA